MQYPSIRIEGAILSSDIIDAIERGEKGFQKAKDFGLDPTSKVKDEIANAWADARDQWRIFQRKVDRLKENNTGTTETRNFWMSPFLGLLGYNVELARKSEEVNGRNYAISHRDTRRDRFPIHIVGCNDSLDKRRTDGGTRRSPHALVQEYLNLTEHLYAVVTNGRLLRLLRDSTRLVKLSFLEFDLDRMFEEELFADFAILFRLMHASRLPITQESAAESIFEIYHQDALDSGSRIRDGLSQAVEKSIQSLANGFLSHAANSALHESIRSGQTDDKTFYQWQLRLIYRLLFLMVIEERDLIFASDADRRHRDIYYDYYSIGRLRGLSAHRHFADRNYQDAWTGLRHTFQMFEDSHFGPKLGIAPLAGDLFDRQAIGLLNDCRLDNQILLTCLRNLSVFINPITGQRMRVNYAALNVEEFGSVYEGLLEYDPQILEVDSRFEFSFVAGDARAASGSHYTPDELVQPLIKHSLDYIIADKLEAARRMASGDWQVEGEKEHAYSIVSRLGCLATGNETCGDGVSPDSPIPEGRTLRDDKPDSSGSGLDSGESGRGLGSSGKQGIPAIHSNRSGKPEGTGNAFDPEQQSGTMSGEKGRATSQRGNNPQQATRRTQSKHPKRLVANSELRLEKVWDQTPLTTRHQLLAEHSLLSITVCDVACGSGHILLNAARRIATELAILRTGEDQPSPLAFRAAVRDVIRNCIYGVDLNPLAVELCKVGLWLEAHVPGEPLNFLDHHIKCGNAIVGLARRDELQRGIPDEAFKTLPGDDKAVAAELRKQNKQERKGRQSLDFSGRAATDLDALRSDFTSVADLPEHTPKEIHQKQEAYAKFRRGIHLRSLKTLADVQVAQFYIPKTPEMRRKITTHDQYRRYLRGENPHPEPTAYAQAVANRKRFFHWFLEYPEVFAGGGFDCILGNPPYLGGTQLSGRYGHHFCEWVRFEYAPTGLSELVVYFLRRIFTLLAEDRYLGILTTNSIKDGDVRRDGLEYLTRDNGANIVFAINGITWPGRAKLYVTLLAIAKGDWQPLRNLNGRHVTHISHFLDEVDGVQRVEPHCLAQNKGQIFEGTKFLGDGFLLNDNEHRRLIDADVKNQSVIFPLINGKELNNHPAQQPSRHIINFFDWTKAEASNFVEPFLRVWELVKPVRDKDNRKVRRERWWQFAERAVGLYESLNGKERCFATAATTKHLSFTALPTYFVYTQALKVLTSESWSDYSVLQSNIHEAWARKYSGALKRDLRYSPRDCFLTFPFPHNVTCERSLKSTGYSYHEHRCQLMLQMQLGLTKTYNLFHNPNLSPEVLAKASKQAADVATEAYSGLLRLRELHREMDETVLAAYGWHETSYNIPAIDLRHDFYEVDYLPENDRTRYTIHPDARRELLKRLLLLNHRRYAEEQAAKMAGENTQSNTQADTSNQERKLPLFPADEDGPAEENRDA